MRRPVGVANFVAVSGLTAAMAVTLGNAIHGQPGSPDAINGSRASDSSSLALELNIPAFRLDVREDASVIRAFTVAVGTRQYRTPVGEFTISRVIWNPWWYPPDAEWAAKDSVTPPGPRNPMGKVKLQLDGGFYVHGTPQRASIGRAASHGCIRMRNEDAVELARIVLRHGGVRVHDESVDTLLTTWKRSRSIDLDAAVPVRIVYRLAEVRDSTLTVYPDVYRRAGGGVMEHVMAAVTAAGYDSSSVVDSAAHTLLAQARWKAVSVPVKSILRYAPPGLPARSP